MATLSWTEDSLGSRSCKAAINVNGVQYDSSPLTYYVVPSASTFTLTGPTTAQVGVSAMIDVALTDQDGTPVSWTYVYLEQSVDGGAYTGVGYVYVSNGAGTYWYTPLDAGNVTLHAHTYGWGTIDWEGISNELTIVVTPYCRHRQADRRPLRSRALPRRSQGSPSS